MSLPCFSLHVHSVPALQWAPFSSRTPQVVLLTSACHLGTRCASSSATSSRKPAALAPPAPPTSQG